MMIGIGTAEEESEQSSSLLRTLFGLLLGVIFCISLFLFLTVCIRLLQNYRGLTGYKFALFILACRHSLIYPVSRYIIDPENVRFLLHNLPWFALCSLPFGVLGSLLISRKRPVRVIGIWACCATLLVCGALTMITYTKLLGMSGL